MLKKMEFIPNVVALLILVGANKLAVTFLGWPSGAVYIGAAILVAGLLALSAIGWLYERRAKRANGGT